MPILGERFYQMSNTIFCYDLKPIPLYESSEMAYLKTHYYGGIKKYQWTAIPLAMHGVVIKRDGTCVNVCVGEEPGDP